MLKLPKGVGIIIIVNTVIACSSSRKPSSELDLPVTNTSSAVQNQMEKSQIPPQAVIDWQSFFKPPPSTEERKILERKIVLWTESKDTTALVKKAQAEMALGRLGKADATCRQILRLEESHHEALLMLATIALKRRDFASTFELLSQLRDAITAQANLMTTMNLKYRYLLARTFLAQGETAKGHQILSDLIARDRSFAPAYIALASSYLSMGRDQVAEFVARRALDRIKDNPSLINILGVITQKSGQFEAAREWYDKALTLKPNFAPALVNRAVLSIRQAEYGAAEEDLTKALEGDPSNVDTFVALALVQKKQGNHKSAKAALIQALDLDPMNPQARFNLAVLHAENLREPSEALRLFQEVLQTKAAPRDLLEKTAQYIGQLEQPTST